MGIKFTSLRGTKDLVCPEVSLWRMIEDVSRAIFLLYGYQEIRTPIIEKASLFVRSLGDDSDIVQRQMFLFKRGSDLVALRPEGTAPIIRAYLEHNLQRAPGPSLNKFFYIGPMFRGERPQKGRLRQFHHIGAEAIGSYQPYVDVELICLAWHILNELGIKDAGLKINSLGCLKDKALLKEILKERLKPQAKGLCPACQRRLEQNPLRILDCKRPACRGIVSRLSLKGEHLCANCRSHFRQVGERLDQLQIRYEVCPHLVRGLEYYTRTVFEITHPRLGAQDALGAGGRYDNLVQELGGPEMGAVGFAFGLERLTLAYQVKRAYPFQAPKKIYLATLGNKAKEKGFLLSDQLRKQKVSAYMNYDDRSLKQQMREADRIKVNFVVFIGEDEIKKGAFTIRDMSSGKQECVEEDKLLAGLLRKASL